MKRTVSAILLVVLLTSMLYPALKIMPVGAVGTIYIRADGSIDPPTAPMQRDGDTYTMTGNITSDPDGIVIERNNMTLDGAGYTLQGTGSGTGIVISGRSNVTIRSMTIKAFHYAIWLESSSNSSISGNTITNNEDGIMLYPSSNYNRISGNTITNNRYYGIWLYSFSNYNRISENNVTNNWYGIGLDTFSSYNSVSGNNMTGSNGYGIVLFEYSNYNRISENNVTNNWCGILLGNSSNYNSIFHNNFINDAQQVISSDSVNVWDDGYPSGGNYWSNYTGVDLHSGSGQDETGSDGIGDTFHVIDENNVDHYPLMAPWTPPVDWWPMFQHDPQHSGHSTAFGPDTNATLWIFQTGDSVLSSPAVVDGRVFVGSWDNRFYCLDYATGVELWKVTIYGWPYSSSPAVSNGIVYAGSMAEYSSKVFALNATTGSVIWTRNFDSQQRSNLNICDGILYVGSRGGLYALNATTGDTIWMSPMGIRDWGSPALSKGLLYIAYSTNITALNATDGTVVWTNDLNAGGFGEVSPTVAYGMVFILDKQLGVLALNATNGEIVWSSAVIGDSYSTPAVSDGRLFITKRGSPIFAFNATTGEIIWNSTCCTDTISSPAVAGGKVFFGSEDGKICALNETNGEICWTYYTGSRNTLSSPAIAEGKLYIGCWDGKIYAIGENHNIVLTEITNSKSGCQPIPTIGQNEILQINVTTENLGDFSESTNVTVYANSTKIQRITVFGLAPHTAAVLTINWSTAGFLKGKYVLSAFADSVVGETNTTDNSIIGEIVEIVIQGDINADGIVDIFDIVRVAIVFGITYPHVAWDPNADLNSDGTIDIFDIATVAVHFGEAG